MILYGIVKYSKVTKQYILCNFGYDYLQHTTESKEEAERVMKMKESRRPGQKYILVQIQEIKR